MLNTFNHLLNQLLNPFLAQINPALNPNSGFSPGKAMPKEGFWSNLWFFLTDWFPDGIDHILNFGAADHLLFVLALTLLAANFKQLFINITFFTLAHGIMLGVAAFLKFQPGPGFIFVIELGIALTIFITGSQVLTFAKRNSGIHFANAFIFGCIHGLGFARDVMDKFQVIIPSTGFDSVTTGRMLGAILGFNFGVDFGQIIIAGISFWVIGSFLANRSLTDSRWFKAGAGMIIAFFGAGMMLERIFRFIIQ